MTARIFAFPRPMGVPDAPRFAERTAAEERRREDRAWSPAEERQRAALATTLRQIANTLETAERSDEVHGLASLTWGAGDEIAALSDTLTEAGR